jgi:hypothetical protein
MITPRAAREKAREIIDEPGTWQFLKTTRTREELVTALDVLLEFKRLESEGEWLRVPFQCWDVFEAFEEALRLLTGRGARSVKDKTARELMRLIRARKKRGPHV